LGNPDRGADSNANGNTNGVTNAYRYGDANGNNNADTKACSITATAPNAAAAPVALTEIVKARTPERNSRVHRLAHAGGASG
jgi:hypothetical protein